MDRLQRFLQLAIVAAFVIVVVMVLSDFMPGLKSEATAGLASVCVMEVIHSWRALIRKNFGSEPSDDAPPGKTS
ncbi:MAG TPA: hypothetical protein VHE37_07480 [Nevskiaceae bacterium]|nr:hypothetical protein [Nevskiaceae bacterium]